MPGDTRGGGLRRPLDTGSAEPPEFNSDDLALLALLCNGHSYADIAAELSFSERTIRRRSKRIFAGLGVSNRIEAAFEAGRLGIIETPSDSQ